MSKDWQLHHLNPLPLNALRPLQIASRQEGFRFVDTLVNAYANGTNCFDQPGEALFGIYHNEELIAVGGLNQDPYLPDRRVGRVRHVYVLPQWRGQGVGRRLLAHIIDAASPHFQSLTLRTLDEPAARFYVAIGFAVTDQIDQASHHMILSPATETR